MSSDPDTSIQLSGDSLIIRTGSRIRTVQVPGLSYRHIGTQYPNWHYYDSADVAAPSGVYGVSKNVLWNNLKEDSAPNLLLRKSDTAKTNGSFTSVPVLGTVYHYINDNENVIVNVTSPTHELDPGIVVRLLDEVNGQWTITTVGFGNGAAGWLNEWLSDALWSRNAQAIGRESIYEQSSGHFSRMSFFTFSDAAPIDPSTAPGGSRIIKSSDGSFHIVDDNKGTTIDIARAPGEIGRLAGSTLGNYLTRNDGLAAQLATSTALGSIGQAFGTQ